MPSLPEPAHQPEGAGDQGHDHGDLDDLEDEPRDAAQNPEGDDHPHHTDDDHGEGVGPRHWRITSSGSYLFTHDPNATFPPCPRTRHSVNGVAPSWPAPTSRATRSAWPTPPRPTTGSPVWRHGPSEKPTATWHSWPSGGTAGAPCAPTATSTSSWSTGVTATSKRSPMPSGTRCGTRACTSIIRCAARPRSSPPLPTTSGWPWACSTPGWSGAMRRWPIP